MHKVYFENPNTLKYMTVIIKEQLQIQNLQCIVFHLKDSRRLIHVRSRTI